MEITVRITNRDGQSIGRFISDNFAQVYSVLNDYAEKHQEEVTITIEARKGPSMADLEEMAEAFGWDD